MSSSPREAAALRALTQMNDWFWIRLPTSVARRSVGLSGILLDGFYVSAWPIAGVLILPVVFWLGLHLGHTQAESATLYIYSATTMMLLVLVSQLGASIGFALWLGYIAGDLLYSVSRTPWTLSFFGSRFLAATVLGLLLVTIPLVARALTSPHYAWRAGGCSLNI